MLVCSFFVALFVYVFVCSQVVAKDGNLKLGAADSGLLPSVRPSVALLRTAQSAVRSPGPARIMRGSEYSARRTRRLRGMRAVPRCSRSRLGPVAGHPHSRLARCHQALFAIVTDALTASPIQRYVCA